MASVKASEALHKRLYYMRDRGKGARPDRCKMNWDEFEAYVPTPLDTAGNEETWFWSGQVSNNISWSSARSANFNRWNGFGGKVDSGESLSSAALRELKVNRYFK